MLSRHSESEVSIVLSASAEAGEGVSLLPRGSLAALVGSVLLLLLA